MTVISEAERNEVTLFLVSRGLTFQPLLDEMTDHICSEIEEVMRNDVAFHEALAQITSELPENHFLTIQTETMKTINAKLNLARVFSFIAMGALLAATIFKLLHLAGGSELLLIGFVCLAISLISGVIPGITTRQEKGVARVVALVGGTIVLMAGYAFKILHLPGADQLIFGGVLFTLVAIIVNTIYVYNYASGHGSLMTYLHEKHSPAIEQFMLFALAPVAVYKLIRMFVVEKGSAVDVVLVVIIYAAALQLIALCWNAIEKRTYGVKNSTTWLVIIGAVLLMIPMLGIIAPYQVRLVSISLFSIVAAILAYQVETEKSWRTALVFICPPIAIGLSLSAVGMFSAFSVAPINVAIVAFMTAGIFLSEKNGAARTYFILSVASFLIEFTPGLR